MASCAYCGRDRSPNAATCPNCGETRFTLTTEESEQYDLNKKQSENSLKIQNRVLFLTAFGIFAGVFLVHDVYETGFWASLIIGLLYSFSIGGFFILLGKLIKSSWTRWFG